jgi:threonine dehydrogenase-like Zn-dependent dehydrogenase
MKQAVVDANGQVVVRDVQKPGLSANGVLTQTLYSVISTGTEAWIVQGRNEASGPRQEEALGNSNCGKVLEVGPDCARPAVFEKRGPLQQREFQVGPGELVACGGLQMASHSEYCSVPRNMFATVPAGVEPVEAAFATLGAVSMYGVRKGRIELGDRVVVVGTGLLGQMAGQLARINGGHVMMIGHRNERRLELARRLGAERVLLSSQEDPVAAVLDYTEGYGADVVLMCAAPKGAGTLGQCLDMVRKSGRIVMVGLAEIEFPFNQWQRKEAELLVSRAYGPGRHDPEYEDMGIDYPFRFVRWTLNRNMQEFMHLVSQKRMDVKSLISHTFPIEEAAAALDLVVNQHEEFVSVVLEYEV